MARRGFELSSESMAKTPICSPVCSPVLICSPCLDSNLTEFCGAGQLYKNFVVPPSALRKTFTHHSPDFSGEYTRARVLLKLIPLGRDSAGCYALLWFTACTCMACAIASWASGFFRFATRTGGLSGQELGSGQAGANPRQSLQGRVPGGVLLWGKASAHRRRPPTSQSHLPRCQRT